MATHIIESYAIKLAHDFQKESHDLPFCKLLASHASHDPGSNFKTVIPTTGNFPKLEGQQKLAEGLPA